MATLRYQHYEVVVHPDGKPFELGRGAMGITYKAFDTNLRSEVCLKVINGQFLHSRMARERFLREARAAARLRHPNVASVYHLGQDGSSYFYSMEFVEGETLQSLVKREGPVSARDILEIALQASRALAAAQREKLVHRDLKPANIMLAHQDGELLVKLIDFGLAKSNGEPDEGSRALTMGFVGTPDYASPEQIEEKPLDTRSDIYSLGATMWYALTGRVMYFGTVPQVMAQQMDRPPPWELLDTQPAELTALMHRMLAKERDQRPRDPVELRGMIELCLRSIPTESGASRLSGLGASTEAEPKFEIPPDATVALAPPEPKPIGAAAKRLDLKASAPPAAPAAPVKPAAPAVILDGPPPETGALVARRYKIGQRLTAQPPEQTFLAEDMATGHMVALRYLEPTGPGEAGTRKSLLAVLELAKSKPHPHLLNVLSLEAWNGGTLVVIEWSGGATFSDRLRARGHFGRPELLHLLEPVAAAADHAASIGLAGLELSPLGVALPGVDAAAPFNPSLVPAVKVGIFGIQHLPPGPSDQAFDVTMVAQAPRTITDHGPGDPDELNRGYQRQLVALIHEMLGRPRPREVGHLAPIAVLGEEGNHALSRARGDEADHGPFESSVEFVRSLRTQTFVSRSAAPPVHRAQSLKIPGRLLPRTQPGVVLTLVPGPLPDGSTPLSTRIVAREEFRIGRSPVDADLVTWFQPRNAENDELTRRLSKVHCYLRRRGGRLMAIDSENSNGTELDERRLPRSTATGEPLPESGVLALDTRYVIDFRLVPGSPSGRPQVDNLPQWAGASAAANVSSPGSVALDPTALGGVIFEPRCTTTMRRAVWLLSGIAFGSDPGLALSAPATEGLRPVQGYIHHHLGQFWLENLDGNGAVMLDGIMLGGNEVAPLVTGQKLRLGTVDFVIDVE